MEKTLLIKYLSKIYLLLIRDVIMIAWLFYQINEAISNLYIYINDLNIYINYTRFYNFEYIHIYMYFTIWKHGYKNTVTFDDTNKNGNILRYVWIIAFVVTSI